jgi:hypothetical protein
MADRAYALGSETPREQIDKPTTKCSMEAAASRRAFGVGVRRSTSLFAAEPEAAELGLKEESGVVLAVTAPARALWYDH